MLDQNERAVIGGNNPPDPIDEAVAPWQNEIDEAENWLDGEAIETVEQMEAVDVLIGSMRKYGVELEKAKKAATAPLHKAWKDEGDRWKPTVADQNRLKSGLVKLVAPIKKRLADEEAAAKKLAWETARRAEAEAEAARQAAEAESTNIDADREADDLRQVALDAKKAASEASKSSIKGMRTVYKHEVTSGQSVINWILENDRAALQSFIADYVAKHPSRGQISGVRAWSEKEAY